MDPRVRTERRRAGNAGPGRRTASFVIRVHDLELLLDMSNLVGASGNETRASGAHPPTSGPHAELDPPAADTVHGDRGFANTAGRRNVTGETRVPRRIVVVDAASAPRFVHASDDPRS